MPSLFDGEYTVVVKSNDLTELKLALDVMRQTMKDALMVDMITKESQDQYSVMLTLKEPSPKRNTPHGMKARAYGAQLEKKPRYTGPRRIASGRHL